MDHNRRHTDPLPAALTAGVAHLRSGASVAESVAVVVAGMVGV